MATALACPKCGGETAATRRTCPLCGTRLHRPAPWVPMLGALALLGLTALGGVLMWAAWPLYRDHTRHAERARSAQGTVINVGRRETRTGGTDSAGRPVYRDTYSAKVVFHGAGGMQTFETNTYRPLTAGQAVTVYFDADNVAPPSLDPPRIGAPLSNLIGFSSAGLLLIVIGGGGLVGVVRHLRRRY